MCSVKFLSDCRWPASIRATLIPDSASRLHAQPPEAPEPTTSTSNCSWDALFTSSKTSSDEYLNDEPLLIHHSSFGPDFWLWTSDSCRVLRRCPFSSPPSGNPSSVHRAP